MKMFEVCKQLGIKVRFAVVDGKIDPSRVALKVRKYRALILADVAAAFPFSSAIDGHFNNIVLLPMAAFNGAEFTDEMVGNIKQKFWDVGATHIETSTEEDVGEGEEESDNEGEEEAAA